MSVRNKDLGAPPASQDRVTDASHEAASASSPSGSVPTGARFTPGPWRACKEGACSCGMVWSVPADFHVATAHQSWGDDPQYPDAIMPLEEMQANARLIAAAPDLVDFIAQVASFDGRNNITHLKTMARELLSRARGEQP